MFKILLRPSTGALVLLSKNSSDLLDYYTQGFSDAFDGRKKECLEWLDDYWQENFVPDEEKMFLSLN